MVNAADHGASSVQDSAFRSASGTELIGVLALQGSFPLHLQSVRACGVEAREVRKVTDLDGLTGLIVPGGESTTMAILAHKYGLFERVRQLGQEGLPIFGTCAGAILLGRGEGHPPRWQLADVEVERNAYGRQIDSFSAELELRPFEGPFHCVFIRAPKIRLPVSSRATGQASGVEVLGCHGADPVLVRCGRFLLATFHPELTPDRRVHQFFLERCVRASGFRAA